MLGCSAEPGIAVQFSVEPQSAIEVKRLVLDIASVSVQPVGSEIEDDNWYPLELFDASFDINLSGGGGPALTVVGGDAPVATYGRIFLDVQSIQAYNKAGEPLVVYDIVEPIALEFAFEPGKTVTVALELVLLRDLRTDVESYSLYTKGVGLLD